MQVMQIIHHVSVASSPGIRRELARFGVVVAESGFVSFYADESNKSWAELEEWIARRRALDVVETKFSNEEIAEARWLELVPECHLGYPQPDQDVFGYRQATYDLAGWCDRCGVGTKQAAPFQMEGEPTWGESSIFQLNWVFDEYFVRPDAWTVAFKPHGVECRPVLSTSGAELKSVVQLVVQETVGVNTDGLATEEAACSSCGRTKYLPLARGRFPALTEKPSTAMVKTNEYFGSGASAHKRVLVSQAVARSLTASKIRGASVRPCAERAPSGF